MRVLFLSRWYPDPPDNGSKIRVFNLIKHLSARHEVGLISFASEAITDERLAAMKRYCRHVGVARYRPFQPRRLKALVGFFSRRPRSVVDTYNIEMQTLVDETTRRSSFDAVVASEIDMTPYATAARGRLRIFEDIELTTAYERYARQPRVLEKVRHGLGWWKLSHYVAGLLRAFDGCTVVSEAERERVLQVLPGYRAIKLVPNGVDTAYYAPDWGAPAADTLVYSGALTYQANFDAMRFFLQEVFPLIQAERPAVKLYITGQLGGVPVDRLPDNPAVVFTGYLDDIRPTVARSWISLVPLRVGGGTRLKILEALALGTPVVATRKGSEGLELVPGRDLLVADRPADFAAAVVRLLGDPALRMTLSQNGRRVVEARYDWRMIGQQFNDFVEALALAGAQPGHSDRWKNYGSAGQKHD